MKRLRRYIIQYILNVLVAFDQLLMAFVGGDPDETWSSLAWKLHLSFGIDWPYKLIDRFFYDGHCRDSWEPDEGGRALWNLK